MIRVMKCKRTNKVTFYKNGNQVFPTTIKGNIATFNTGELILI
jgi:hypothetical protein